jgi:orotate phosphoribosyltransferase
LAARHYFRGMTNQKIIAGKLLQIQAIRFSPAEPFTWASGWKSPIYCDNRKALSFPFIRDFIKSELCNVVFEGYPEAGLICGVATAGIAWGIMAADQLKLPYIYCRAEAKAHGLARQIEGEFAPGAKVVVVEDLVSTGKSSLRGVEVLRENGLEVVGMVSIFTYGFPEADAAFNAAGVELKSLTDYTALLELSVGNGTIKPSDQDILLKWSTNPSGWQGI